MMGTFKKVALSGGDPKVLDEFSMPEFYLCTLYHAKKQLKAILEFAMEPSNHPVVINCTMGKDRTGELPALFPSCRNPSWNHQADGSAAAALSSRLNVVVLRLQGRLSSCCCGSWAWSWRRACTTLRSRTTPSPGPRAAPIPTQALATPALHTSFQWLCAISCQRFDAASCGCAER